MTGVSLAMLIPVFLTRFPEASLNYKFSVGFKLLGQLPVLIAAVAMMCSIGLDNAFKQWIPQVLTSMGTPAKEASLSISIFGLAMMSGRFILSTIRNMTAMSAKILIIASVFLRSSFTHSLFPVHQLQHTSFQRWRDLLRLQCSIHRRNHIFQVRSEILRLHLRNDLFHRAILRRNVDAGNWQYIE